MQKEKAMSNKFKYVACRFIVFSWFNILIRPKGLRIEGKVQYETDKVSIGSVLWRTIDAH